MKLLFSPDGGWYDRGETIQVCERHSSLKPDQIAGGLVSFVPAHSIRLMLTALLSGICGHWPEVSGIIILYFWLTEASLARN